VVVVVGDGVGPGVVVVVGPSVVVVVGPSVVVVVGLGVVVVVGAAVVVVVVGAEVVVVVQGSSGQFEQRELIIVIAKLSLQLPGIITARVDVSKSSKNVCASFLFENS
jgi:hypothetical protein